MPAAPPLSSIPRSGFFNSTNFTIQKPVLLPIPGAWVNENFPQWTSGSLFKSRPVQSGIRGGKRRKR
jgi:hypothetical protein